VLVDTHCHLADEAFAGEVADVLDRAAAAGVLGAVVVGESPEAAAIALRLAQQDARVSATAGIHPHLADRWDPAAEAWLAQQLRDDRVVAAGEMGLDYHYDHAPRDRQRAAFAAQLALAARAAKPAVIHARDADEDVTALLRNQPDAIAILHSFSGGDGLLEAGIALGSYFSFSGMVTFRNWQRDAALRRVPRDRLLVETDAPYLAPVPYRGQRNEPAYVVEVARRLAEVLGLSLEEVARITTENAVRVFGPRILNPQSRSPT
jgi:TatD DNase family protein